MRAPHRPSWAARTHPALTSPDVLEVEADLTSRLAARGAAPIGVPDRAAFDASSGLDAAQRDVVTALAGDAELVVVEGAAGAGKTTTLAAARSAMETRGAQLRVVTPTLKAARVAAGQVGSAASSAAWLAYQHGFRWDEHGHWTRLQRGAIDPDTAAMFDGPRAAAVLRRGDRLIVDEAGMLDQDTARALLTIADEHRVRVAMVPMCTRGQAAIKPRSWNDPRKTAGPVIRDLQRGAPGRIRTCATASGEPFSRF